MGEGQHAGDDGITRGSVGAAILLIAGTTVGGGFLALPSVVAPTGFLPSAIVLTGTLSVACMPCLYLAGSVLGISMHVLAFLHARAWTGVWLFFVAQSMVVVEVLCDESGISGRAGAGMTAVARRVFGRAGEVAITSLIVILTQATIVSQISKAGSILAPYISTQPAFAALAPYASGCVLMSLLTAGVVFGGGLRPATQLNSVLTSVFGASAVSLFFAGSQHAEWSRLAASTNWLAAPAAVPVMLQLLVYGEILPSVCALLQYNVGRIRVAILLGSFIPLVVEVGWAALGISLVEAGSMATDPVDVLLAASPVKAQLLVLAASAISTTVIGSYLALHSVFGDILASLRASPTRALSADNSRAQTTAVPLATSTASTAVPLTMKLLETALIALPPLAIACRWVCFLCTGLCMLRVRPYAREIAFGPGIKPTHHPDRPRSPALFLGAIDFAGSYPVALLWGVAPPLLALRMRRRRRAGDVMPRAGGPDVWVATLAAGSCLCAHACMFETVCVCVCVRARARDVLRGSLLVAYSEQQPPDRMPR